jgi:GT2 family glycosyltransferase
VDFCLRAKALGWQVWYDPSVMVTHHWPLHARKVPAPLRLMTRHALLTFTRKHWATWQARILNHVVRGESIARMAMSRFRGEAEAAASYRELRAVAKLLQVGETDAAMLRIRTTAAHLAPVAAAQDGRTR